MKKDKGREVGAGVRSWQGYDSRAVGGRSVVLEGATRKKVAISENHVSTSTAQQSGAFSVAELQQQQQQQQTRDWTVREQRVVTAAS